MASRTVWKIDGTAFPRNPDYFEKKPDPAAVSYVTMADGSQRRVTVPKKFSAAPFIMEFKYAQQGIKNFILPYCDSQTLHKILIDGVLPAQEVWCYLETPEIAMSKDTYNSRAGEGGFRQDLKVNCRTDGPYNHSHYAVPSSLPTAAQVASWFGGPTGTWRDSLPAWNGNGWQAAIATGNVASFNLGTAPWSPVIRLNGPFNTGLTITATYQDVDGTGSGVQFVYNGPNVAAGDYLLLDISKSPARLWQVVSGAKSEIYGFAVNAVSSGTPFAYFPPFPSGAFSLTFGGVVGTTGASTIDFSNAGTETFRYW